MRARLFGLCGALCGALCAVACLLPVVAEGAIESEGATVRKLSWHGLDALSEGELEAHILTSGPSRWRFWRNDPAFSESLIERDMERIEALYRRHGFYDARAAYDLTWNEELTRVEIDIRVEEGLPIRTTEVSIRLREGTEGKEIREEVLLADLPLRRGSRFALAEYGEAKQRVLSRLAEAGHPMARIEGGADIDVETQLAQVRWVIDPGPRVRFGEISITGLDRVRDRLVRRNLAVGPGDVYSVSALERTRRRLQALGLFRWVVVTAAPPEVPSGSSDEDSSEGGADAPEPEAEERAGEQGAADAVVEEPAADGAGTSAPSRPEADTRLWPVLVDVAERPPRSVQIGAGAGTEEYVRGRVSWRDRNFLGGSRRLGATLRGALPAERLKVAANFTLDFVQPQLFDTKLDLVAETSLRLERQPAFDAQRSVTRIGVTRPISEAWTVRAGYEYSLNDITTIDSDGILDEPEGLSTLSVFDFGVRRSTTNDPLDPRRGSWLDFSVVPALGFLGGDFAFVRMRGEGRLYRSAGPVVFAGRLELAAIQPLRGTAANQIPLTERLFAGGTDSLRGVAYQVLGPRDEDGDPIGGTTLAEASFEVRFPVWKKLGGVWFTDAAQIDLEPFRLTPGATEVSTGLGIRYYTAVGPLRGDFGVRLHPSSQVGGFRFHFSVGQSF